ncbi:MAG: hypothetical protein Q7R52_04985 [archaeon]|nr:hypothetical protein [archaeon]
MAEEQINYSQNFNDSNIKIRDLEEKQKIIKDRVLLIGKNLVEIKEKNSKEIIEIKKDLEKLQKEVGRISDFIETFSSEFSKFARKEDVIILTKQAKMFQPLEFVRKSELKEMIKNR